MRFVCPDGEPQYRELLDAEQLAQLSTEEHELEWFDGAPATQELWIERLNGAEGVLLLWELPGGVLRACPTIDAVSFVGTGVESYVDMDEARACGVAVCNVPVYGANGVAEHALALALAVARDVAAGDASVRRGEWWQARGLELSGRRLGVVGAGLIGARMVELGRALRMDVVCWTRTRSAERERELGAPLVELDELFSTSHVVSIHIAHRPETEGLVDARLLGLMRPDAILVNTARGAIVDERALAAVLEDGRIFGAALDVFSREPPPPDHPLLGCPRTVLTPHLGFFTVESSATLLRTALGNLLAFARGEPQNVRP
jgi:phosphoglycerate dehydrogenase-like enzyme